MRAYVHVKVLLCTSGALRPHVQMYKTTSCLELKLMHIAHIQVVSTDSLARGARVMRERGLAVPVDRPKESQSGSVHCSFCFRAHEKEADVRGCCVEIAQTLAPIENGPLGTLADTLAQTTQVSALRL